MNEKTIYELRNLPIPAFLYKETRLSVVALKVYCFVHAYTNPFFFGNEHLSEMFGCSAQAISDAVSQLTTLNYIKTEYKPKAGGGKTRLVIDLFSDYNSMTNRKQKVQATTSHQLIDKDIKENNKKENLGENLVDEETYADKGWLEAKRKRKENKGRGVFQGRGFTPKPGSTPSYQKKERTAAHGEDVV